MSSCVEEIFLFQKKLNKYARLNEADKVLYYLHKLNHLNVTVSHLEETGVGKTVNALRHQGGKVGEKARGLVNKWKAMVTAEEEEEEEEEAGENEELQTRAEMPAKSRNEKEPLDDQDEEEDEEENCLQIEENNNPITEDYDDQASDPGSEDEPQPATSVPRPTYGYSQGASSGSEGEDAGDYNPMTSRMDYQAHMGVPVAEYHPSNMSHSPKGTSSPEWGGSSPGVARNWKNGTSARSPGKKSSKEEKDHGREREKHKNKGKGKHRDSSSSHERERKKDKHKDKHREKEERREEVEEEKRVKSHKDKHRDREKHHGRPRESKHRGNDTSEQSKYERESEASAVNGFNTPDHKDRSSKRESRESDRSVERERVEEGHYQSGESTSRESAHQNRLADRTKPEKERHRESSKKEKHKKEHREKEESPDRQKKEKKSKHHAVEDEGSSNSVNKDSSRVGERTVKEGKGKHKENKHKHKDSSKKDKHKRDSVSKQEVEEHESPAERNKKEKKSKSQPSMDSGFGAVLMGLDTQVKKKKKKRKKDAEKDSGSEDEQPSTSAGYKRGLAGNGGLPDSKKPKLLSTPVDRLPKLPTLVVPNEKPLLPEITPNYKPLPRLPVRDEAPEACFTKMTEEEALNFVFQSKYNRRSKVYSGKVCGLAYVPTLYETCIRVLQENIDALEYTGGIPFEILRPVLERASAKQLLNLEDFNHYLLQDSDVLWEVHCKRDFKKMKPDEFESWREMWIRCSEERDRRLKSLTHNLTEKFLTKAEPKRTTKIAYVDTAAKVPKSVARAQAKYGTATASALAAKPGKGNELAARKTALQNVQRAERVANPRPTAAKKKKVAPLMAKTKQFFKKAFRR